MALAVFMQSAWKMRFGMKIGVWKNTILPFYSLKCFFMNALWTVEIHEIPCLNFLLIEIDAAWIWKSIQSLYQFKLFSSQEKKNFSAHFACSMFYFYVRISLELNTHVYSYSTFFWFILLISFLSVTCGWWSEAGG